MKNKLTCIIIILVVVALTITISKIIGNYEKDNMAEIVHTGGESTDSLAGKLRYNQADGEIVGVDGNIPRLLITTKNNDFSMKVAQSGVNVYTATNDQLVFNSNNNLFKIVATGEVSMSMPTISPGTSHHIQNRVTHSLGYTPLPIAFITMPSTQAVGATYVKQFGSNRIQAGSVSTSGVVIQYLSDEVVSVSDTDIYFDWTVSAGNVIGEPAVNATIEYFLLSETAAT